MSPIGPPFRICVLAGFLFVLSFSSRRLPPEAFVSCLGGGYKTGVSQVPPIGIHFIFRLMLLPQNVRNKTTTTSSSSYDFEVVWSDGFLE